MNVDTYAVINRQQIEKQCQSTEFKPLVGQSILTYSYKHRYEFKKNDKSKCRFCQDPQISKEYENVLYEKFREF